VCVRLLSTVPYPVLKAALPTRGNVGNQSVVLPSDKQLQGFDMDFVNLIFIRMLGQTAGWSLEFHTFGSFTEMWLGVLADVCHISITASQMDPTEAICPYTTIDSMKLMDYGYVQDYNYGDYAAGGIPGKGLQATLNGTVNGTAANLLSCLNYGAPYVTQGFALLSLVSPSPFDVLSSLFNSDVCNVATVIVIIACSAGFLVSLLERKNPHVGTLSRGAYWALFTFINGADEHPRQKSGRTVMVMLALSNMITVSIITSIISAKLTTASLSVTVVDKLGDVKGTLCVESNYAVLSSFVARDPNKPVSIVSVPVEQCIQLLMRKSVVAVITDQTVLSWYSTYYQLDKTHISPVLQSNPFTFVYKNVSLMQYVNPAVIAATQTDANWIPATEALKVKYFGNAAAVAASASVTPVNYNTVIVAVAMAGVAFLVAFTNGDWGKGIQNETFKSLFSRHTKRDMSDEDAAKQGDEQALVRLLVKELREVKESLDVLHADVHAVKARVKHGFAQVKQLGGGGGAAAASAVNGGASPDDQVRMARTSSRRIDQWVMTGMPEQQQQPPPPQKQEPPPVFSAFPPPPQPTAQKPPKPVLPPSAMRQQPPVVAPVAAVKESTTASIEPGFCGLPENGHYVFPWTPQPSNRK
jgi:ABC-type amino acid transport substrate-binding protein